MGSEKEILLPTLLWSYRKYNLTKEEPEVIEDETEVFKDQPEVADDEPEVELINWNGYKFEKILTKEEPENS